MNVPGLGMARYGMRSNEISIFGLEFEFEDDLRLEGGVDPPFQTSSLERHLQASVSMPIFRGLHGNSASQSESKSGFTDPFQMPRKVIQYLYQISLNSTFDALLAADNSISETIQSRALGASFLNCNSNKLTNNGVQLHRLRIPCRPN